VVYIELFHGRRIGEELQDWGSQGPVFKAEYFHTTYATEIKFNDGDVLPIAGGPDTVSECVHYDGIYYGDWSVFDEDTFNKSDELKSRFQEFDQNKANIPTPVLSESTCLAHFSVKPCPICALEDK
jgi:hypothetical protein